MKVVGVIGAGAMGSGIAQIAAQKGHQVKLMDQQPEALEASKQKLVKILSRLVEKGRISEEDKTSTLDNIDYVTDLNAFSSCNLVIEAIVERLDIKKAVFQQLEEIVGEDCILASNTSSLSIASIAASVKLSHRVLGIHFFNPAPLMPLVEIIPAVQTSQDTIAIAKKQIDDWGKITVLTKDTPGFIVNRVARPFYGEALRIYEEGIADMATIDWAMRELGGFRMGPFQLMDFIGNDVNYAVTESVFEAFYYDHRYKPSFTQKRHAEAGWLGRKTGRGYYDYSTDEQPQAKEDHQLGQKILDRILAMLINEAADALLWNIASETDIDLAMTKGVNYPKGLLAWANEIGIQECVSNLDALYDEYREDRYRCSPILRRHAEAGTQFTLN
ncbi:MAG: NAD(P)-binding domain-containing protein [Flavobacteriales bacterium]|nr:NAD(P)-binding domain-containing protein [Flavobacteriales bacterium]